MKTDHPIRSLCAALEVSASGYYGWSNRQTQPSRRAQENVRLAQQIVQVHQDSRQTYGSPRIQKVLGQAGHLRRSDKLTRYCSGKLIHPFPSWTVFFFPSRCVFKSGTADGGNGELIGN